MATPLPLARPVAVPHIDGLFRSLERDADLEYAIRFLSLAIATPVSAQRADFVSRAVNAALPWRVI
jgi:hypothetical protein